MSEIFHFDGFLLSKACTASAKKYRKVIYLTLMRDAKFKETLTCSFKHDIKSLVNFHPTILKIAFYPKYKGLS